MFAFKTLIALGALVGAAVIPLAAAALEAQTANDQAAAPVIADSQIVARDPETGKLRAAFMNYSVVVRTADGKLVELCVQDPSTLTAKPAQSKKSELPTE